MDPLKQFEIVTYFPLTLLKYNIDYTNSSFALSICTLAMLCTWWFFRRNIDIGILYLRFIQGIIRQNATEKGLFATSFVSSIFLTVLLTNIIGLVPKVFTVTSHIIINFVLACIVLLYVIFHSVRLHGRNFIKLFIPDVPFILKPLMFVIEVLSFSIRAFSLSLRLAVNMTVGHVIMKIFLVLSEQFGYFGVLVWPIYLALLSLELFVAVLQAYIFTFMTCIYIRDAVECGH